ncbi:MAG: LA2681 family HEPN domain-containing protein, partial [bacterium]
MENIVRQYQELMSVNSLTGFTDAEAINYLGQLINAASDLENLEGLDRAINLSTQIEQQTLSSILRCYLNYNVGNAWSAKHDMKQSHSPKERRDWELPDLEQALIWYRRAVTEKEFSRVDSGMRCRVYTNLANQISHVGRFIEALDYYGRALDQDSKFAMAHGNRGLLLAHYANHVFSNKEKTYLRKYAIRHAMRALNGNGEVTPDARDHFESTVKRLNPYVSREFLSKDEILATAPDESNDEMENCTYWCLYNQLYLNPLNDIGPLRLAAEDSLHLPNMLVKLGRSHLHGFYNQLKQEFVSARYLLWKGLSRSGFVHFSDKNVILVNTWDYPCYSLGVEEMKAAFRVAYSLFDKIAFLLNEYFCLHIPEKDVKFRTLWYKRQARAKGLRCEFKERANYPLRGLFWLSKDL